MGASPVKIASLALVLTGAALLGFSLLLDGPNLGLPVVILLLGGVSILLVFALRGVWSWSHLLYIPGCLLAALGVVLLLTAITGDGGAWAYAWLLLAAGLSLGLALSNHARPWHPMVAPVSWGAAFGSLTLFVLFGAIAGGLFIRVMAPLLIIVIGLALRFAPVERYLPEPLRARMHRTAPLPSGRNTGLVEALSGRELEVLQLVEQGLSNQEIAARLNIAASTVKTHINNIFSKLSVQNRAQAVRRARDLGLIDA